MPPRPLPDFSHESAAPAGPVAGVDEVGRGPWAGPVVAAAAIVDPARLPAGVNDSKRLTAKRREALAERIREVAEIGLGVASVEEIDRLNIGGATDLAMRRALANLPRAPGFALVDGRRVPPGLPCPAAALIGGDGRALSIAAASIVAKVARDRIMAGLAAAFPGFGWERNAGYGTAAHAAALARLGPTPHHRRSFRPIAEILLQERFRDS